MALSIVIGATVFVGWLVFGTSSRLPPGATGSASPRSGPRSSPPTPSASPSPEPAVPPLPTCEFGDKPAERTGYGAWRRTLLDTSFALPETYVPPGLVSTTGAGFDEDLPIRSLVMDDLAALRQDAEAAGNPVALIAAYRDYEEQALLFEQRKEEGGVEQARRKVARPGHSEHQLGTAVDFKRPGQPDVTARFGSRPEGEWLSANAWRYGFVLSYPADGPDLTCYSYEPWHYRYFGTEMAADIHASGQTVREYLWELENGIEP